jgi:hypothetical protein
MLAGMRRERIVRILTVDMQKLHTRRNDDESTKLNDATGKIRNERGKTPAWHPGALLPFASKKPNLPTAQCLPLDLHQVTVDLVRPEERERRSRPQPWSQRLKWKNQNGLCQGRLLRQSNPPVHTDE